MKKNQRVLLIIVFLIVLSYACMLAVSADCGPKPSLTIYVENAPDELYYLDLLLEYNDSVPTFKYDNLKEERELLNQKMLSKLSSYKDEGWIPALSESDSIIHGSLLGSSDGNIMIHRFGYYGVPNTFRILIVTESGNVSVTETINTKSFDSTVYYNYADGSIKLPALWKAYLVQFLITCTSTLVIEGIILLLFGYKLKDNWKPFITINVLTQILLTFTAGVVLIKSGTWAAVIIQVLLEIFILIIEIIAYRKYLVGNSKRYATIYGAVANLTSWIIGLFLIGALYDLLEKLV